MKLSKTALVLVLTGAVLAIVIAGKLMQVVPAILQPVLVLIILLAVALLFIVPIIALVLVTQKEKAEAAVLQARFCDGFKYSHLYQGSGIAINPETQRLRLRKTDGKNEIILDYPLDQLRDFEKVVLSGGELVGGGGGLAAGVAISKHNARKRRENEAGTGIFVNVKDIENPRWRIAFGRESDIDRWMEILRQS